MRGIHDPSPSPSPPPALGGSWPCQRSRAFFQGCVTVPPAGSMSLGFAHGSSRLHSLQKGLDFSSCGQWEEAITCYLKDISLDPQRPRPMSRASLQGRRLLGQELYCEAFTQAAEPQTHHRVFRRRSIVCLMALNKFPECLWMLNRDLEEDVRNPDLYVLRASFYKRFGQGDAPPTAQGLQCSPRGLRRARELGARRPRRLGGSWHSPTMTAPCTATPRADAMRLWCSLTASFAWGSWPTR
ncbi:tetratricopeptide repeat protein 16 isoform X2 [Mycteria americana]|uniref:tetratricopeptide repeat protein 16 isoform X2 n=1 Tax=Mycteria americana TaxID=33587 RepID=UPI003F585893